jgi:hypothetical protein
VDAARRARAAALAEAQRAQAEEKAARDAAARGARQGATLGEAYFRQFGASHR